MALIAGRSPRIAVRIVASIAHLRPQFGCMEIEKIAKTAPSNRSLAYHSTARNRPLGQTRTFRFFEVFGPCSTRSIRLATRRAGSAAIGVHSMAGRTSQPISRSGCLHRDPDRPLPGAVAQPLAGKPGKPSRLAAFFFRWYSTTPAGPFVSAQRTRVSRSSTKSNRGTP